MLFASRPPPPAFARHAVRLAPAATGVLRTNVRQFPARKATLLSMSDRIPGKALGPLAQFLLSTRFEHGYDDSQTNRHIIY